MSDTSTQATPARYTVRVQIPFHLQTLAGATEEVQIAVTDPATQRSLIVALERQYPQLRSAVVDLHTDKRRPLIRFFACQQDISFQALDTPLPPRVLSGEEPFMIVGAISGG